MTAMLHIPHQLRGSIWLLPVALLMGCSRVSPPNPAGDLNCEVYDHGRPVQSVVLTRGEPGWNEIVEIVESKRGQWDESFVDFAPVVLARSGKVTLNFQQGRVVANFVDDKGKPRQVVAPLANAQLANDEFARVLRILDSAAAKGGTGATRP